MSKIERQRFKVKIIDDKKQLSVRFPVNIVSLFDINSKSDEFEWIVIYSEEGVSLMGHILKGDKNAKKTT